MTELMTKCEAANLERLKRKQERVLKTALDQRAAELKADFETQMATVYHYDQDEIWKEARNRAQEVVDEAQAQVAARCKELGIPREYAPSIDMGWYGRGENAIKNRRAELRLKATAKIDALKKAARTKIEMWSLTTQTELASRNLTTEAAKTSCHAGSKFSMVGYSPPLGLVFNRSYA